MTNKWVPGLAINSNGDILAGTVNYGFYRSTDNGNTWLNANIPGYVAFCLAVNSSDDIFVGTPSNGVFRSTDSGINWVQTSLDNIEVNSIAINLSGTVFCGTVNGAYRSIDNGDSWTQINSGLSNAFIRALGINSLGHFFAASVLNGIFRSTDNGENWTVKGLTDYWLECLAINSLGHIFVGATDGGVFRSTDNGDNWTNLGLSQVISLIINSSGHIFAGTYGAGALRSTDNGESWTSVNNGLSNSFVYSFTIDSSGNIFAGTYWGGAFSSTDNGESWAQLSSALTDTSWVSALASKANGYVFAGTLASWPYQINGVYRSTDYGDTWTLTTLNGQQINTLLVDIDGKIFAATSEGVFYSTDNGATWTQFNSGLGNIPIDLIALDNFEHIYAFTSTGLMYKATLPATDVERINNSNPSSFALVQNYPNPFNPSTKIKYSVPQTSQVQIKVFDVLGNEIETLISEEKPTGTYELTWNAEGLPSGVYFYQLKAGDYIDTKKMILFK